MKRSKSNPITAKTVVDYLNGILEVDPAALRSLIGIRIPACKKLADHPPYLVDGVWWEAYTFDVLNLLNGIVGLAEDGQTKIGIEIDADTNKLSAFTLHE